MLYPAELRARVSRGCCGREGPAAVRTILGSDGGESGPPPTGSGCKWQGPDLGI
jgi:hypothetical protein